MLIPINKVCTNCLVDKIIAEFYNRISSNDGKTSRCKICIDVHNKKWCLINSEKIRLYSKKWRINNKEKRQTAIKKYEQKNRVKTIERKKQWFIDNPEYKHEHYVKNKFKYIARAKQRKIAKLQAVPSWANLEKIAFIYKEKELIEKETGIRQHVDHIVPLQSKNVCGLHVENNLRIISAAENIAKGNRYWPDMP